ncbi:response regulator [Flavihumibacter petaseus]|uniref:Putative two-component response regulator n=1 Tax=Flavihumibacter petaseus NBRC 106054 TaxID=1220578 RepID=A0A0E9MUK5_9BACT|nr:response regulator transcription factor [Flavihumibacter petaseus]GAO41101.1 putative two-component response regulator [Flavihumibacter petaseus NBRC 106054]
MSSILLADDHHIVIAGIKNLLTAHFNFDSIGEAHNETEIMQRCRERSYDLMLLDVNLPGSDFPSLMDWLHHHYPLLRVIVFTMHSEQLYGVRAIQLGAKGFLQKTADNQEILLAIRRVIHNQLYISNDLAQYLLEYNKGKNENPFAALSSRELEIARLLGEGKSLPDICQVLNIQYSTGNTYKRRIFEKLKVDNLIAMSKLMITYQLG